MEEVYVHRSSPLPTPSVLRNIQVALGPESPPPFIEPPFIEPNSMTIPFSSTPHPQHYEGVYEYQSGFEQFRTPTEISSGSDDDMYNLHDLFDETHERRDDDLSQQIVRIRDTIGMRQHDLVVEKQKLWRRRAL